MKKTTQQKKLAYSLLELLMVMAILGIVGAIGFINLMPSLHRAQLRQVSGQLAIDLEQVRGYTQRLNQNSSITVTANNYTVQLGNAAAQTKTFPTGISLEKISGDYSITYTAPFGEIDANPSLWELHSVRLPDTETRKVKIIGVTGKVIEE